MKPNALRIVVEIPLIDQKLRDDLFEQICDVVVNWEPANRNWDAGITAHSYCDDLFPDLPN